MRDRVAFLHLPKSAGSSVRTAVAAIAGPDRVAPWQLDRTLFGGFDEFDRVDPAVRAVVLGAGGEGSPGDAERLGEFDVVLGHFALSTLRRQMDDADVFSLLREPRARLVSHFSFWLAWSDEQHAAWAPYAASRVPAERGWEGFLTDPALASQTDNLMVRLLLAPHPDLPADGFIATDRVDQLAEQAAAVLARLGHVDIIDRGSDFWAPLSAWIGAELREVRDNVTPPAAVAHDWAVAVTARSEAALADRTRGDRRLWDLVAERTMTPAEAAALADASYLRQVLRAARPAEPTGPTGPIGPLIDPAHARPAPGRASRWRRGRRGA